MSRCLFNERMNHSVFGRKLSRSKNERKRLFSSLVRDLILHGKIVTSRAKAKAIQPLVEQLITKAKKGTEFYRREILKTIAYKEIVDVLMADAKDRFAKRNGGYTRMIKIGNIRSDGSEEVMLSFVDEGIVRTPVTYDKPLKAGVQEAKVVETGKEVKKVKEVKEDKKIAKKVVKKAQKTK